MRLFSHRRAPGGLCPEGIGTLSSGALLTWKCRKLHRGEQRHLSKVTVSGRVGSETGSGGDPACALDPRPRLNRLSAAKPCWPGSEDSAESLPSACCPLPHLLAKWLPLQTLASAPFCGHHSWRCCCLSSQCLWAEGRSSRHWPHTQ